MYKGLGIPQGWKVSGKVDDCRGFSSRVEVHLIFFPSVFVSSGSILRVDFFLRARFLFFVFGPICRLGSIRLGSVGLGLIWFG